MKDTIEKIVLKEQINKLHLYYLGAIQSPISKYYDLYNIFWDSCVEDGKMIFNKIIFPDMRGYFGWNTWGSMYADTMMIHHLYNDNYSRENSDMLEYLGGEGSYFVDDVIAKKGDVVIDAGAYIGDFSASAAVLGAEVYAFEPMDKPLKYLRQIAEMNNFTYVEEALGGRTGYVDITMTQPGEDFIDITGTPSSSLKTIKMNTIDNFAKEKSLHIDFIKSDIEGYERFLLRGAEKTIINDEPKISMRTYHHKGADAIVLPQILKEINPRYKIFQNKHTMFASVER